MMSRCFTSIKALIWLALFCGHLGYQSAHGDLQTKHSLGRITGFELPDQHGRLHQCIFPKTNFTVVTVADRKGAKQVESWVRPLWERYGERIDLEGVADVSAVPRLLRGWVTGRLKKAASHPVLLDWTGAVCRQFAYRPGQVNVLLLDREGNILMRWVGPAHDQAVAELFAELDRAKP